MKTKYENSLKYKILQRIENIPGNVVLPSDFEGLGSYRQISRVLNDFIKEGKLARISFGVYAKAETFRVYWRSRFKNIFWHSC